MALLQNGDQIPVKTAKGNEYLQAFSDFRLSLDQYYTNKSQGSSSDIASNNIYSGTSSFTGTVSMTGRTSFGQALTYRHTTFAVNISAVVLAANFINGYFTSTSAAAVGLTTDTATAIATALGAVQGTVFDFYVDNTAGANDVTVILGAGIVVATPVITGGDSLITTAANGIGIFRLVFSSNIAAKCYRIG